MMKTIRTITLAALMLAALPAKSPAQTLPQDTTLNRTVVVEQEYTPDIRDAAKVNAVPAVEAPVVQPKAVEYDNRLQPLADIPAGNMPAYTGRQALPKATPGYLRLGYGNYGIDTWAISENAFQAMLDDPEFDFNGFPDVDKSRFTGPYSYTVSQYFRTSAQMGGMDLQIRTSGYARFADTQIDSRILEGEPFNATGILTYYNSGSEPNYQFTLLDLGGIEIPE